MFLLILFQDDKEVRLFDKGEMNTYKDELSFSHLASRHLRQLLTETIDLGRNVFQDEVEHKKVIYEKISQLKQNYQDKGLPAITAKTAFVETSQIQSEREQLLRLSFAELALELESGHDQEVLLSETSKIHDFSNIPVLNLNKSFGIWSHFKGSE